METFLPVFFPIFGLAPLKYHLFSFLQDMGLSFHRGQNVHFLFLSLSSCRTSTAPGEAGVMVFAAPIKGKVLQLLSHHIIYGEIVVPGGQGQILLRMANSALWNTKNPLD